MFCLDPPLEAVPDGEWYCTSCLVRSGGDYGFEEGETYSLHEFKTKADDFKRKWFPNHPDAVGVDAHGGAKGGLTLERAVEREFWKLVESPHVNCEVEYGADLHSTVHGSGFPTIEKQPLDPYSRDPWNLNIIPVLRDSLFSHIKSDISGMMVPWLYVGMCFSTFCWHNEDHYTYSVNYMHWGDTKTWYGVPSSDAERFEQAMKEAVPELFEDNPDLLLQLVTMLSPGRLMNSGVKVFALDQRPGQFVVTFPQSYHAGFNHGVSQASRFLGNREPPSEFRVLTPSSRRFLFFVFFPFPSKFNFNEAVNFAPPDWEPFGLSCARRYLQYRRMPVFSHDELLVTALRNDSRLRSAAWLRKALAVRRDQELGQREKIRGAGCGVREVKEETPRQGDM
ncbi:MAG: JmjC domain, hydroxylase-domain-containing protein, partial [Olpidium bornovanus]